MTDYTQVLNAIGIVRRYLQSEFICDSCADTPMFGCVSCNAVMLDTQLQALANSVETDASEPLPLSEG